MDGNRVNSSEVLPPRTFHTLQSCRIFKLPVCYVVYTHEYLHVIWEYLGSSWTIKTEDEGARSVETAVTIYNLHERDVILLKTCVFDSRLVIVPLR